MIAAPRHLYVRLPNPLGDAVMATPALRALRTALPRTRITWAGGRAVHEALAGLPFRDAVMPMVGRSVRGWRGPFRAARLIRALDADAALLLPNSSSSALGPRIARVPVRVGTSLKGRGRLLTHRVEVPLTDKRTLAPRHMVDHYMDLVAPFGATADGKGPHVVVQPYDHERALRRLGAHEDRRLLAISPGASFGSSKVYPPAHIAAAVQAILDVHDELLPIVLSGPGEDALGADVAQAIGPACLTTHQAPPDVGELKALLARAQLCLATDAGPRHIAQALDVPTVTWVGPTDPRWGGVTAGVVRNEDLACLACHFQTCPIAHPCMQDLPPARVADAALALLAARREIQVSP